MVPTPDGGHDGSNPPPIHGVRDYYAQRIRTYGPTPEGVDWNGEEGQWRRFEVLLTVTKGLESFTIAELGCGYGALLDFIAVDGRVLSYVGLDIAPEMITAAHDFHSSCGVRHPEFSFVLADHVPQQADIVVASGILNVRASTSMDDWGEHVDSIIRGLASAATQGFSFNCLRPPSPGFEERPELFYGRAEDHLHLVEELGWRASLIEDYGLWEYTIVARRTG